MTESVRDQSGTVDGTPFREQCATEMQHRGRGGTPSVGPSVPPYETVPYTWPQARPPMAEFSWVHKRLRV